MKVLALLALLIVAPHSEARSIIAHQTNVLKNVSIDGKKTQYVGMLDIDYTKSEISVVVYNDICHSLTAEPGTVHCMAVAMPVATLHAPLQTREMDGCGSVHYAGMVDQTPVDGVRTEIKIVDHNTRKCEDVVTSLVVVNATVLNPWTGKTTTYDLSN